MIRIDSSAALVLLGALTLGGCPAMPGGASPSANENADNTSNDNPATGGGTTDPRIGQTAALRTYFHGVSGTARIVDDRTIVIEDFFYDGGGPDVRIYGDSDDGFASPVVLSADIGGAPHVGGTLTLNLPSGVTLDDVRAIAVWCVIFDVNFGDGVFQ